MVLLKCFKVLIIGFLLRIRKSYNYNKMYIHIHFVCLFISLTIFLKKKRNYTLLITKVLSITIVTVTVYYNTSVIYKLLCLSKTFSAFVYLYENTKQYIDIITSSGLL